MLVTLRDGETMQIDEQDKHLLAGYRWRVSDPQGYAVRDTHVSMRQVRIYFHRVVLDAPLDLEVDHINGDRLDNRRANLRLVTRAQNRQNLLPVGGSSQHRGVSWHKRAKKWRADVKIDRRQHYLGLFDREEEAAQAAADKRAELMTHARE